MSGQLKVYTRADRNGHRDIQSVSSQPLHGLEAKFDSFQSYAETMRISEPHNKPATKRLKGARHKAFALLLGYLPELAGQAFMAGFPGLCMLAGAAGGDGRLEQRELVVAAQALRGAGAAGGDGRLEQRELVVAAQANAM